MSDDDDMHEFASTEVARQGAQRIIIDPRTGNPVPSFTAETRFTRVNIQNAQNVVNRGTLNVTVDKSGASKKKAIKNKKPLTDSDRQPTQNQLMDIKDRVGTDWKDLGRRLEFDDAVLEQMRLDNHQYPLGELIYQILRKWIQRDNEKATRRRLANVFMKLERGDLADFLADDTDD